jgi:uncharacterized membrane protein (DUF485 family)
MRIRAPDAALKKVGFLTGPMVFSLFYYFLLPIGAAYFTDLFKIKVYGVVNVGILFALAVHRRLHCLRHTAKAKKFDAWRNCPRRR